ncbi:MAG: hypothetical protein H0V76_10370 [Blastocatellia bacterium]|nr:hypothetical protein [Blastocatellia bacterium]
MPSTAIIFGAILILIGVIGYILSVVNNNPSMTAMIPAIFGVVLAGLGFASRAKESLRKHLMHAAVLVALLGFVATAAQLVRKIDSLAFTPAVISQLAMATVCFVFVVLAVRSFAAARRANE